MENKPSLFRDNAWTYNKKFPITQNEWGITKTDEGHYVFGVLENDLNVKIDSNLLETSSVSFRFSVEVYGLTVKETAEASRQVS